MALTSLQIETITRQVYRQFPEVRDARPTVQNQQGAKAPASAAGRYLLTYRGRGAGPSGQTILRIVRVVADDRGKVLKISTSR
jgi:hypothetical protein